MKEQKKIEKRLGLSPELLHIVGSIRMVGVARFYVNEDVRQAMEMITPLIRETSRRTLLAMSQLDALHFEELKNLLLKDEMPNLKDVNKRKKGFFIYIKRRSNKIYKKMLIGEQA